MNISFTELKELVEELPIGLYAHRRIPCELDKNTETSYYMPNEDKIVISYRIIAEGLANTPNSKDYTKETAIRSMLYHEVSHAILTPRLLAEYCEYNNLPFDIMNIFEDERIETILKDFYLDVNFKKQLLYICGGKIPNPTNAEQEFYNLVRFRVGKKEYLDRVKNIIKAYSKLNYSTDFDISNYIRSIRSLWEDISKDFNINNNSQNGGNATTQENNIQNSSNSKGTELNNRNISSSTCGNATTQKNNSCENSNIEENNFNSNGIDDNNIQDLLDKINSEMDRDFADTENMIEDIIKNTLNKFNDSSLTANLENVISQFNKKNKGGNGINAYSGIFNPKAVARKDYKYFERAMSSNGNNKFGTCHLNLFIDCSGSFSSNENRVNTLLKSLTEIERRNKNFTFDTIFCGSGLHEITDKKKRWLKTGEGTSAEYDEVKTAMKNHNLKNTMNYNIVLYDGYCSHSKSKNPFLAWDTDNTTLIIERGNYKNVEDLTKANIIRIDDDNYVKHLTDEIIKVLSVAFH